MTTMRTLGIIALGLMLLIGGGMSLTNSARSEASTDEVFDGAIDAINSERAKNSANEFTCTQFFSDFYRVKKTEPYVVFFKRRGVQAIRTDANQQHYVYFEIPAKQLRSWGYSNFYRGDRLVLVFTTASSTSDDITSFSARLFGRTYP